MVHTSLTLLWSLLKPVGFQLRFTAKGNYVLFVNNAQCIHTVQVHWSLLEADIPSTA